MTFEQRKATTQIIIDWLIEAGGDALAHTWLWSATPYPCALPFDEQLEDGLRVAAGELTMNALLAQVEAHMEAAMAEMRAARATSG